MHAYTHTHIHAYTRRSPVSLPMHTPTVLYLFHHLDDLVLMCLEGSVCPSPCPCWHLTGAPTRRNEEVPQCCSLLQTHDLCDHDDLVRYHELDLTTSSTIACVDSKESSFHVVWACAQAMMISAIFNILLESWPMISIKASGINVFRRYLGQF